MIDELTAKLEAIEVRAEARAAERFARTDTQMARFEERLELSLSHLAQNQTRLEAGMANLTSSIGQMKWWMIGTGLTVVLGIAAFNATVLSNMVSSFDSGRETANQNAAAAREISNAIRELHAPHNSKNPLKPQKTPQ